MAFTVFLCILTLMLNHILPSIAYMLDANLGGFKKLAPNFNERYFFRFYGVRPMNSKYYTFEFFLHYFYFKYIIFSKIFSVTTMEINGLFNLLLKDNCGFEIIIGLGNC